MTNLSNIVFILAADVLATQGPRVSAAMLLSWIAWSIRPHHHGKLQYGPFVRGIHRLSVDSPHKRPLLKFTVYPRKGPVIRTTFPYHDVMMLFFTFQVYSMGLTILIFFSMCLLSVDTLREFRVASPEVWIWLDNTTHLRTSRLLTYTDPHPAIMAGEIVTLVILTFDFLTRVLTFPGNYIILAQSMFTYVTIFTIIPSWAAVFTNISGVKNENIEVLVRVFYGFRALRVFYFFRLAKQYPLLLIIVKSLARSFSELTLLIILLFMGVSFYGTLLFYVELRTDNITNLLDAYWWALITMTTVGYGDVTPVSGWGRLIGCMCAVSGIVAVALPIPVIVRNFDAYFVCVRSIERMQAPKPKPKEEKPKRVRGGNSKINGTVT